MNPHKVWVKLKYATIEQVFPTREEALIFRNKMLSQYDVVACKFGPVNN